jgi:Flp pilus assembly protein TadD
MTATRPHANPRLRAGRSRAQVAASVLCLMLPLSGCQLPTGNAQAARSASAQETCGGDAGATKNTRLAAVEQMIGDGKHYAALAELDAIGVNTQKASWLRAEALRRIDHIPEAMALYETLLGSCLEGRAQHGLGLSAAQQGQRKRAIDALARARQLLPTDPRVRNDLGYALLLDRRWDAAQFEFLTVLDLAPQDPLAARNLVLLAFVQGKADLARSLAARFKLDDALIGRLALQATSLMYAPAPAATASDGATAAPPLEPVLRAPPLTTPASDAS